MGISPGKVSDSGGERKTVCDGMALALVLKCTSALVLKKRQRFGARL
jgi:hypothetical protein